MASSTSSTETRSPSTPSSLTPPSRPSASSARPPIAEYVYATGTKHGKRVQALGGAKNHMIVMPDADLDQAADALVGSAYGSAGERCMAISVAVAVGKQTADTLRSKLEDRIAKLRVDHGAPESPDADFGPLITGTHRDKVASYIDIGKTEGAELIIDGRAHAHPEGRRLLPRAPASSTTSSPRCVSTRKRSSAPCSASSASTASKRPCELVNDHEYGNGTSIFTRDGDTAREFGRRVQAGMVGINVPIPVPMAFHSFGGWKRSLFGDHSIYGPEGVRFYTRLKTITARWPTGIRSGVDTSMPTLG